MHIKKIYKMLVQNMKEAQLHMEFFEIPLNQSLFKNTLLALCMYLEKGVIVIR